MRGKVVGSEELPGVVGITPRVRGKASTNGLYPTFAGITPACAGKSKLAASVARGHLDHPRVCGEKLRIVEVGRVKEGSPPRMRGKVEDAVPPR